MLTWRFVYEVRGVAKFLSHLDILKLFNRALLRAGLPVAYSEGFNPHARISFGPPRGVGQEGLREYGDLQLREDWQRPLAAVEVCRRLNLALPKGVRVLEGRFLTAAAPALMAEINLATYEAVFNNKKDLGGFSDKLSDEFNDELNDEQAEFLRRRLAEFASAAKAEVWRHHPKKGDKLIDLKVGVSRIALLEDEAGLRLALEIPYGEGGSVKPVEVMSWLLRGRSDISYRLSRTGLYVAEPGGERRLP